MLHHSWGSWPICETRLHCPDTKQHAIKHGAYKSTCKAKNITCNLQLSTPQPMLLKTSLGRLSVSVCCHNHYCNAFLGKVLMPFNNEQCQINSGGISNGGKVIEGRFVARGVFTSGTALEEMLENLQASGLIGTSRSQKSPNKP